MEFDAYTTKTREELVPFTVKAKAGGLEYNNLGNNNVYPGQTVKVDGNKKTSNDKGIVEVLLEAGDHTITKANTANLFLIALVK